MQHVYKDSFGNLTFFIYSKQISTQAIPKEIEKTSVAKKTQPTTTTNVTTITTATTTSNTSSTHTEQVICLCGNSL